jgi:ClpP class serine protease
VIFASFGFPELMARQGVERRVVTAGRSKSFADPFLPQKAEDVERLKALQDPDPSGLHRPCKALGAGRGFRHGGPVQRRCLGGAAGG